MGRVVAAGELLVVRELGLHRIKLLLTHHGWHLGDGDPLLWLSERMSPMASPNWRQRRLPLKGQGGTAAPRVTRSRVHRDGHSSPPPRLAPTSDTRCSRNR